MKNKKEGIIHPHKKTNTTFQKSMLWWGRLSFSFSKKESNMRKNIWCQADHKLKEHNPIRWVSGNKWMCVSILYGMKDV
jgi:hypothetical protein